MQREGEVWPGKPVGSGLSTTFTPMSDNWITDRQPTEADGDSDGDVTVFRNPSSTTTCLLHWSFVKENVPWRRTIYWQPPAPPAELSLSDFKVGQTWRTRGGKMCEIITVSKHPSNSYPILSNLYEGHWHFPNGRSILNDGKNYEDDLIELISEPAPAEIPEQPAQPAQPTAKIPESIPESIRTGAAPFYVMVLTDDNPRFGGKPIVWEHPLPRGTTLQAALQRRDSIGNRYGTTYIAECRIIPELTREVPTDAA